jgi:hypothetical protein
MDEFNVRLPNTEQMFKWLKDNFIEFTIGWNAHEAEGDDRCDILHMG